MKIQYVIAWVLLLLTVPAIFPKETFVVSLMVGGNFVSPEGSKMLSHYCFGDGDTLYLRSNYIKKSPVVLESIKGMKVGETRNVRFKQSKDWRLSYAFNPFHIKREKNGYVMYETIQFDTTGKIHTDLNLGVAKIRIHDNVVHCFDCKPYVAVYKFTLED